MGKTQESVGEDRVGKASMAWLRPPLGWGTGMNLEHFQIILKAFFSFGQEKILHGHLPTPASLSINTDKTPLHHQGTCCPSVHKKTQIWLGVPC